MRGVRPAGGSKLASSRGVECRSWWTTAMGHGILEAAVVANTFGVMRARLLGQLYGLVTGSG